MPRQIIKLDQFHGGLNSNGDPRDIQPNEMSEATDVMVDELGKIRVMGGVAAHDAGSSTSNTIKPGYGLFQFSHDRKLDSLLITATGSHGRSVGDWVGNASDFTAGATSVGKIYEVPSATTFIISKHKTGSNAWSTDDDIRYSNDTPQIMTDVSAADTGVNVHGSTVPSISTPETGEDYLVFADTGANADIDIFDSTGGIWTDGVIDLGSTTGMKPAFYAVDGALRVSDGNFGAANETKWYGYINRRFFGDGTLGYDGGDYANGTLVSKWHTDEVAPKALAVKSFFGDHDAGATPDASSPIAVELDSSSVSDTTTAWFPESDTQWECAVSTLYDDSKQESPLYVVGGEASPTTVDHDNIVDGDANFDKRILTIILHVFADTNPGETSLDANHPRVSGFKIYMRKEGETTWYLQAEVDVTEGMKRMDRGGYKGWNETADLTECAVCKLPRVANPRFIETYEHETGFDANIQSIGFDGVGTGFKTAVVTNRAAYVGNVMIKDWHGDIQHYGDAVLKSTPNWFDSFTPENRLEASIRDGDEVVKLEEFADRLLIFKKNKMELLNISQEIEFLEETFVHKGVSHPAATCKTDFGIAWVNIFGCFLYDGQKVINLLEKQGRQIIKESEWDVFLRTDKTSSGDRLTPMIGYLPQKRQIIVFDDITTGGDGTPSMYLYDIVTQSWVKGATDSTRLIDIAKTNFETDWNGDLIYSHTNGTVVKWDDTGDATDTIAFKTKDIDFGQPAIKKTVYKVAISYKGDGSSVTVKYGANGETDASDLFAFDSANLANKSSAENLESWHLIELAPGTASEANDIYSFQIVFDGTAGATFEINDISIVYRSKSAR